MAATIKIANNARTTVVSGLNNVTDPVTFVAAAVPTGLAAPEWYIMVDAELLLVTAVAGTSLTVSRAHEGTAAANHADGAAVTHLITAAGLKRHIQEQGQAITLTNKTGGALAVGDVVAVDDALERSV